MAKLQESDFYYGAVLSVLLNDKKGAKIMLVEGGEDRRGRMYDIMANDDEFKLLIKYRSKPTTVKAGSSSWTFNLTTTEIELIQECMRLDKKFSLGLVCGNKQFNESEYAVLQEEDIKKIFERNKINFTVSRKKGKHFFDLIVEHKNVSQLKADAIY